MRKQNVKETSVRLSTLAWAALCEESDGREECRTTTLDRAIVAYGLAAARDASPGTPRGIPPGSTAGATRDD